MTSSVCYIFAFQQLDIYSLVLNTMRQRAGMVCRNFFSEGLVEMRRLLSDTKGVEGDCGGGVPLPCQLGVSPPLPTRRSGRASWAPPAGSGAEPRPQTSFQHFLNVPERFRLKEYAIFLSNMVTDKVEKFPDEHHFILSSTTVINIDNCKCIY